MYKILIVDDEVLVRVGIKSMLNWEAKGYTIIDEASNGFEALTKIEEQEPHIIFVDLIMKKMNGFELITAVKKNYPNIKIIVLSCYNDFQNVKEAMRLGADDYIFKLTVTSEELLTTLEGLKDQIDEKIKKDKGKNVYDNMSSENIATIKDKKFKIAIEQSYSNEKEFCNELSDLNMKVNLDEEYSILIIKVNCLYELNFNGKIKEKDILNSAIGNMISETLQIFPNFELFNYTEWDIVVIINLKENEDIEKKVMETFIKIKDYLHRYLGISVSGGLSAKHKGIREFKAAVLEAEKTCNLRFYSGSGRCLVYLNKGEELNEMEGSLPDLNEYSKIITESIERVDHELCNAYISEYITKLKHFKNLPEYKIRNKIHQLLYFLNSIANRNGVDIYLINIENFNLEPQEIISKYDSIDEILAWMNLFIIKFIQVLNKKNLGKYREEIIKIQYYITNNLDRVIDVPTAANYVNMSESYFSHVFKKDVGISFIDYVNNEKIEKAKELITSSNYKIYEVSDKLGFQNSTYFTMLFKKVTGLSPSDYKKSIKIQENYKEIK